MSGHGHSGCFGREKRRPYLPQVTLAFAVLVAAGTTAAVPDGTHAAPVGNARPSGPEKPNFVVIVVDDLGWTDLGCMGSSYYETPHIDRLASEGILFTNGYAAGAVCSPTRAALLTGRYPARTGVTDWIRPWWVIGRYGPDHQNPTEYEGTPQEKLLCPARAHFLEPTEVTIAELLKPAGYVTAHIGKWHLGQSPHYPTAQGFDINIGGCDLGHPPSYFDPYQAKRKEGIVDIPTLPPRQKGEYLTDREADEAVAFLRQHRDRPFYLQIWHYCVHTPLQAKEQVVERFRRKEPTHHKNPVYAAMIGSVDDAVGRIIEALQELGLEEKTLVIFTSDNGGLLGPTDNRPLRLGKGYPYEGGIRVPWIARWKGVIPPGRKCATPICSIDLMPTLAELAGVKLPTDRTIDGQSLVPLLLGTGDLPPRALFWHFPHYRETDIEPFSIVRVGRWKLIRFYHSGRDELYDLEADIGETQDLAIAQPDRLAELRRELEKFLQETGARVPRPNPNYRPPDSAKESQAVK
ncbi:MAG: sulfatase [Thermoguttaceae bacterium]|nr:sulfatase [Thermoguttaceae bacterium]MDW8079582.1 sulfatase [Thermoguttaceae bacterium]